MRYTYLSRRWDWNAAGGIRTREGVSLLRPQPSAFTVLGNRRNRLRLCEV